MYRITHRNEELGIESRVLETPRGFTVLLHDLDADETLPTSTVHQTLAAADAKAKHLVGIGASQGQMQAAV